MFSVCCFCVLLLECLCTMWAQVCVSSCQLTLLCVVSVGVAGHARGQPPRQAGSLSLSTLVFHFLPIPNNIVLPLQLSDHQEELILKSLFVLISTFVIIVFITITIVSPQKLERHYAEDL